MSLGPILTVEDAKAADTRQLYRADDNSWWVRCDPKDSLPWSRFYFLDDTSIIPDRAWHTDHTASGAGLVPMVPDATVVPRIQTADDGLLHTDDGGPLLAGVTDLSAVQFTPLLRSGDGRAVILRATYDAGDVHSETELTIEGFAPDRMEHAVSAATTALSAFLHNMPEGFVGGAK